MRFKLTFLFLLINGVGFSQVNNEQWLDIMLTNYEYPFEVEYIEIDAQKQKLKMAYMDINKARNNGKTIMLLHGKNFNGAYWETTINALTTVGYRIIVPDQIGFGKSSKPDSYQYSFQALAKNTKAILDSLGISKTAVLGHSMGGMLATRFALMYPEVTEKLILENPIGLEDWKLVVPYQTIDQWYAAELKKTAESIKAYQLKYYYDGKWKSEYDQWVQLLSGWTFNSDYPLIAWNAALTYDMIFNQPVLYEFKNIKCPTLLIIGTRDRTALGKALVPEKVRPTMGLYSELGKKTHQKIPNSELVEIENVGHLPHIESFEEFIDPLKTFLRK
ncbi:alpha/beta hydrolase [Maribacter sp. TH_r10]|uniref:alpha/beta fold hydrolase n=1 Tax=Maribacter sp. TH_r10 TaxID=3082086 RepID=UPI002952EC56|nr:alpha/beta hydrolase [Maribacter sp. TH_r10]MDV7139485.1 alpha/beta hydrolase [Maribacter sp. TH_r10]